MKRLGKKVSAVVLTTVLVFSGIQVSGLQTNAAETGDFVTELFGNNVYVFDDNDSDKDIQKVVDQVYATQEKNQFGQQRYALLFKPGNYDNVRAKVGFYTQVAGLGQLPTDTVVNELDCNADWMGANATCNFWRSAENFTVNQTTTWAAAQATSLRRMNFKNWLGLDQWGQGWASGGFVADTVVQGAVIAWSQQQYCSRNSDFGAWEGGVWNAVFVGMNSDLKEQDSGNKIESNWQWEPGYQYYTSVEKTPVVRETPYITVDNNDNYSVYVPSKRTNSNGVSWENGKEPGRSIDIEKFYIAKPEKDNADTINSALASGKNLIFTPGIYKLNKAIKVTKENTVVLGMGYATLTPTGNNACMEISDVDGVSVSGLLYDAGPQYTETLLKVGEDNATKRHLENPMLLSDLFFRVGGVTSSVAQTKTCVIINSKDVIGDNFWVWRADHGEGVAWDKNKTENGIIINGDCMTMYGLFVEHFHNYQTIWNGNYGRLYFYQSEIPYDIPNQSSWKSHNGTVDGYSSYKVGDKVTSHEAYGLGIYSYHRDATVNLENAIEVPDAENVSVHNACTVMLAGNPGISHVINGLGNAVTISGQRQQVVSYGQGKVVIPEEPVEEVTTQQPTIEETTTKSDIVITNPTNVALNKKAYSSSDMGWNVADLAVDGNNGSRWESQFTDNQYWYVDLGTICKINQVNINWETAAGKDYTIDVSTNGTDWQTVYTVNDGKPGNVTLSFPTVVAKYVRMNGTSRTTQYGFSIWEFQVMGEEQKTEQPTEQITTPEQEVTTSQPENTENLAKGCNVSASSQEGPFVANNCADGNVDSRWASEWAENQWVTVDLGSVKNISKVILKWEAAYGKSYKIQVSQNGTDFITVASETNGDGGIDQLTFGKVGSRYVRMQGVVRGTGYGYSLWEFEVY